MCFDIYATDVSCPHLKGNRMSGATCVVMESPVRLLEDVSIRMCLSRRFESCQYYVFSLRSARRHFDAESACLADVTATS